MIGATFLQEEGAFEQFIPYASRAIVKQSCKYAYKYVTLKVRVEHLVNSQYVILHCLGKLHSNADVLLKLQISWFRKVQ